MTATAPISAQGPDSQPALLDLPPQPAMKLDYYAVCSGHKAASGPLCHVHARDGRHALKIARDYGLPLTRHARAHHIGRERYFAALRQAFPATREAAHV